MNPEKIYVIFSHVNLFDMIYEEVAPCDSNVKSI
jgi:hypothetical protein